MLTNVFVRNYRYTHTHTHNNLLVTYLNVIELPQVCVFVTDAKPYPVSDMPVIV